jgi:hypothetical protein
MPFRFVLYLWRQMFRSPPTFLRLPPLSTWRRVRWFEPTVFALWAAFWTLYSARSFYSYMLAQTGGEWSAPLDDVFIHFDFARATAEGHPFEWVSGNGYSTGNTSMVYPFVLALGYRLGLIEQQLMQWAGGVACVMVFIAWLAYAQRRGPSTWERFTSYLLPPLVASTGVLAWSLWSGMEVALFVGLASTAQSSFESSVHVGATGPATRPATRPGRSLLGLGSLLAVLYLTRPEALCMALVFAATHLCSREKATVRAVRATTLLAPTAVAWAGQTLASYLLLGEVTASGALVKLGIYTPYLTAAEKWTDYVGLAKFCLYRLTEYHLSDVRPYGVLLLLLALAPLADQRTRARSFRVWMQITLWVLLVALNGQVRWQNQRYLMPAVFWTLELAVLGFMALMRATFLRAGFRTWTKVRLRAEVSRSPLTAGLLALTLFVAVGLSVTSLRANNVEAGLVGPLWLWPVLACLLLAILSERHVRRIVTGGALFLGWVHLHANLSGQIWFFGRAARNIRDQQVSLGRYLHTLPEDAGDRGKRRVLVGDAGAIAYASNWGAIDFIGLGGFGRLPFARANTQGIAASVELLEHVPIRERPEFLAIFPSWWEELPLWFASKEIQRFPAAGNVICGDYEHVLYRADWRLLESGDSLAKLPEGSTQIRDVVDIADVISERAHNFRFAPVASDSLSKNGGTVMHVLPTASEPNRDVWDGGRELWQGGSISFRVRHLLPGRPLRIVVRATTGERTRLTLHTAAIPKSSRPIQIELVGQPIFQEPSFVLDADDVHEELTLEIVNDGPGKFAAYHLFSTQ